MLAAAAVLLAAAPWAAAPSAGPTARLTAPDALSVGLSSVTTGSPYAFTSVVGGQPVRWDPCTPIHWRFRVYDAPTGGLAVTRDAVARIARATGTRWVYDGTATTAPTSSWPLDRAGDPRPVLIGWTNGQHSDLLRGRPAGVLGVTRTVWFYSSRLGGPAAIRSAVVALDRTDRLPMTGAASWHTVLLHELGHVMGLAHAGSSREVMYPTLSRRWTDLQSGDLEGLRRLGRAAGCVHL